MEKVDMSDDYSLWEKPDAEVTYMFVGWHQWADAGSVSSGLPQYLIQQTGARQIGVIHPDGFYLFQIPGTHDLVRPVVRFEEGYPVSLKRRQNDFHFAGLRDQGLVFMLGDEPHLDSERYVDALLSAAQELKVKRIVSFGGVYGELPYDKERLVSAIYSQPEMKSEFDALAVNLSDYRGGASIGSYLCKRAGELGIEAVGFYAFVPIYDFSDLGIVENTIRIENDYLAWLGVMRRVNYMLKLGFDLSDLEERSQRLIEVVDKKIAEMDEANPQAGLRDYLRRLSDEFEEMSFNPLDDVWEEEIRRLMDRFDESEEG
jgi:proteasome assembly chaperone (PAC2) family protein